MAFFSEYSESLMAEEGAGKYFNDYGHWRRIAQFVDFVYNSEAAEIVGKLLQSEVLYRVKHNTAAENNAVATTLLVEANCTIYVR